MTAEQIYALAVKLEEQEALIVDGEVMPADALFGLLEALDELGADLLPALERSP